MQIVDQSASFLYSRFPTTPLLTAPPARKAIAAPRIAGLLPATVEPQAKVATDVVVEMPLTRDEVLRRMGPIRSRAEMNAEIVELIFGTRPILNGGHPQRGRQL